MGNRHAVSLDVEPFEFFECFLEPVFGNPERQVNRIKLVMFKSEVMNQRTQAVRNRIADDAVHGSLGADFIIAVNSRHFRESQLTGGQFPLAAEGGIGEGGTIFPAEDTTDHAVLAHAEPDGGHLGIGDQLQHANRIAGRIGHGDQLDDIRILFTHRSVDLFEVVGCFIEIVMTDNAFGFAIAGNRPGDVVFNVDVFNFRNDRGSQQRLPLFFRFIPAALVFRATAGDDHRRRPVFDQTVYIGSPGDPVQPQFYQFRPFFREGAVFHHYHFVSGSTDADTNH